MSNISEIQETHRRFKEASRNIIDHKSDQLTIEKDPADALRELLALRRVIDVLVETQVNIAITCAATDSVPSFAIAVLISDGMTQIDKISEERITEIDVREGR